MTCPATAISRSPAKAATASARVSSGLVHGCRWVSTSLPTSARPAYAAAWRAVRWRFGGRSGPSRNAASDRKTSAPEANSGTASVSPVSPVYTSDRPPQVNRNAKVSTGWFTCTSLTSNGPIAMRPGLSVSQVNRFVRPRSSPFGPWMRLIRSTVPAGP
jgi:hypothetical protein